MSSIGRSQKKVGDGSMTAKGHPSQSARTPIQSGMWHTLTHSYTQIYIKTKWLTTHFAGKSQKRRGNEMTRKKQHRCHSQWASPSWPQSSGGSRNCMKRLRGWWLNFLLPTKGLMSRSAGYKNSLKKSVWWRKNLMGRWITWSLKRQPCQAHSEYRNVGKEKQILRSSKKEKLMLSRREEIEGNEIDCGYLTYLYSFIFF